MGALFGGEALVTGSGQTEVMLIKFHLLLLG